MKLDEKNRLSLIGDTRREACAIRLRASRMAINLTSGELATELNLQPSNISNMEKSLQFPSLEVMHFLYKGHRIDHTFILHGDFAQLPTNVQDELFAKLAVLDTQMDRKQRSDST